MRALLEKPNDLFNPTENHLALRENVAKFAKENMDSQAKEHDDHETFNLSLFRRIGSELGLFGITVPEEDGGMGMDAVAAVIIPKNYPHTIPILHFLIWPTKYCS